ncbi:MAG: hypothetical protein M3Z01_07885 [Thermoproteota archaeon]|nr:hypothetical protein [Thermoproteota archaeon]
MFGLAWLSFDHGSLFTAAGSCSIILDKIMIQFCVFCQGSFFLYTAVPAESSSNSLLEPEPEL